MEIPHRQRPLSAVFPGERAPLYFADVRVEEPSPIIHPVELSATPKRDVDPRRLFADKFWGPGHHRRHSDSAAQLSHHSLPTRAWHGVETVSDVSSGDNGESNRSAAARGSVGDLPHQLASRLPEFDTPPYPRTPTPTRNSQPPEPRFSPAARQPSPTRAPSPPPRHSTRFQDLPSPSVTSYTSSQSSSLPPRSGGMRPFLHCPGYTPHVIHPRNPYSLPSRRDDFLDALGKIETMTGPVGLKGVGHLAKPAFGKAQAPSKMLSHFLHRATRTLLVPNTLTSVEGGEPPSQRDLARLESELFDTSKYVGGGGGGSAGSKSRGKASRTGTPSTSNHLTVLTWSDDDAYGTITLFEADLSPPPTNTSPPPRRTTTSTTSTIGLSLPSLLRHPSSSPSAPKPATGLRPVAAMEDVPRQVLVNMRVDAGIKKAVLQHDRARGRFRWTAQQGQSRRRGGGAVRQARVWVEEEEEEGDADSLDSFTDDGSGSGRVRGSGWGRSRSRRGHRTRTRTLHAAPGVVATIPQFLALTHASRATLDEGTSFPASTGTAATEDGEKVRVVSLGPRPGNLKGARHKGRDVHVVVLVPDGARWAEERIFWTDGVDGLAEWTQKKYGDVVLPARKGSGMRGGGWGGEGRRRDITWEREGVRSPGERKLGWGGTPLPRF